MKLGIDATNISSGGGLNHLLNILASFDPGATNFHEITVWGSSKTLSKIARRPWLSERTCNQLDGNLLTRTWWKVRNLTREVREAGCDVLFVPGGSYTGRFHPFVTMSRNMLPFEWREMLRFGFSWMLFKLLLLRVVQTRTYRRADGLIFLTDYARNKVLDVTGSLNAAVGVIPHGINPVFFRPVKSRKTDSDQNLHIIYVSIIDMYKHQGHVAEAVCMLRKAGYPVSIDFVGPAYAPALKLFNKIVRGMDPEGDFIRYRGNIANERLPELYANADICLFASSCENMPNILLEGMASGLPVVSSNRGPMPEILGDAGVYFDPENPVEIFAALKRVLESEPLRAQLAEKSLVIARMYSWEKCANATLEFLEQIADRARINRLSETS